MKLTKAQIGRCGELLVQYALLSRGVESAPMSTDTGIDLVAFFPASKLPATIQVKTNHAAKPSGGKGAPIGLAAQRPSVLAEHRSLRLLIVRRRELPQN